MLQNVHMPTALPRARHRVAGIHNITQYRLMAQHPKVRERPSRTRPRICRSDVGRADWRHRRSPGRDRGPDAVTDMTSEQAGMVVRQFAPQKQRPQELRLVLDQPERAEGGKGPGRSIGKNAPSSLLRDRSQIGGKIGGDGVYSPFPQRWIGSELITFPKRLQIGCREY